MLPTKPAPDRRKVPAMRLRCRLADLPRLACELYLRNERQHLLGPAT